MLTGIISSLLLFVTFGCSPINGGWTDWTPCSLECGGGTQTRTCTNPIASLGGKECEGPTTQECNAQACVIDGGWSDWSECMGVCEDGIQIRNCDNPIPGPGGADCVGVDEQVCDLGPCDPTLILTMYKDKGTIVDTYQLSIDDFTVDSGDITQVNNPGPDGSPILYFPPLPIICSEYTRPEDGYTGCCCDNNFNKHVLDRIHRCGH